MVHRNGRVRLATAVAAAALVAVGTPATAVGTPATAVGTPATAVGADAGGAPDAGHRDRTYTFLSAPDLFNGDIGDARKADTWRRGMPNSWNRHWAANVENVFGQLAAFRADDYLVIGDLVEGQWHRDKDDVRVFGAGLPAVTRAGNLYYSQWKGFWRQAGVRPDRVHVGVGDHEIGDNLSRAGGAKYRAFDRFKSVFAQQFTKPGGRFRYPEHPRTGQHRDTAYATYLARGVLLVTVDVFTKRRTGTVATVDDAQLAWVRRVLASARPSDTVIVQGHTPALGPVRTVSSSGLVLEGGEESAFWDVLREEGADLYLAGEVHADTAIQRADGEPLQVTHGGLAAYGATKFMTGEVTPDGTVRLVTHRISKDKIASEDPQGRRLWGTAKSLPWKVILDPYSTETGTLTLSPDGEVEESSGNLEVNSFRGRRGEGPRRPRGWPKEA